MAIKQEQATVGAVVYLTGTQAPLKQGKILAPLDTTHGNSIVVVEWHGGQIQKVQLHLLLSETDGLKENQRLVEEEARLEREFAQAQVECGAKLNKAAQLIREAATLAESKGTELREMYDECRELMRALDAAGWSSSSMRC